MEGFHERGTIGFSIFYHLINERKRQKPFENQPYTTDTKEIQD